MESKNRFENIPRQQLLIRLNCTLDFTYLKGLKLISGPGLISIVPIIILVIIPTIALTSLHK